MKTDSKTILKICRLLEEGIHSRREIGRLVNKSPNTVKSVEQIKNDLNLNAENLDETSVFKLFFKPNSKAHHSAIDCLTIHNELSTHRDLTQRLLWEEYCKYTESPVSYSQYSRIYRQWLKTISVSMRQAHYPGEHLYVDFCGHTITIRGSKSGEEFEAQIFVGCLGASGYIFATAVPSQKVSDFIQAHIEMFADIGGVPKFVVPDNLKSAVIKNTRSLTLLNQAFAELSEHYGFIVLPARSRKPKDKSLGEIAVQIVQRYILARLRHRVFFHIDELNEQIQYWLKQLNQNITRTYKTSRIQRLIEVDRPALQPLPERHYPFSRWEYQRTVDQSYHVFHDGCYYSVPYTYAYKKVDLRFTNNQVLIYYQSQLIATHMLNPVEGKSTSTQHMPPHHKAFASGYGEVNLLEWSESIGAGMLQIAQVNLEPNRHYDSRLKQLNQIRRLTMQNHWKMRLEQACIELIAMKSTNLQSLLSILKSNRFDVKTKSTLSQKNHPNIRGAEHYSQAFGELHASASEVL